MTRKRFVRLVMATGKQRNEAAALAGMVKYAGSYSALYDQYRRYQDAERIADLHNVWVACKVGAERAAQAIVEFGKALAVALAPALEGFRKLLLTHEQQTAALAVMVTAKGRARSRPLWGFHSPRQLQKWRHSRERDYQAYQRHRDRRGGNLPFWRLYHRAKR